MSVDAHLKKNPEFFETNKITFMLADGSPLADIVPLQVVNGMFDTKEGSKPMLFLDYLSFEGIKRIEVTQVRGLRVSEATHPTLRGKLLMQFNYLNTRGEFEETPRDLFLLGVSYGIHPLHAGVGETKPDFYWVGINQKDLVLGKSIQEATKQFPTWRSGQRGKQLEQIPNFIRN